MPWKKEELSQYCFSRGSNMSWMLRLSGEPFFLTLHTTLITVCNKCTAGLSDFSTLYIYEISFLKKKMKALKKKVSTVLKPITFFNKYHCIYPGDEYLMLESL
jgi:hypothetical protein